MGNIGSSGSGGRRGQGSRRSHPPPPPPAQPQPEIPPNRYVFAAATPFPTQYPNGNPNPNANSPQYYPQYPGFYPPPPAAVPLPLPAPYDHHHHRGGPVHHPSWVGGRYPCGPMVLQPPPYVEHQMAVSIRNDVNVKKETLRIEAEEENPGKFLVSFTFDATVDGSITVVFFAKEGDNCNLIPTKEMLPPVTVHFQQGLSQKFQQPPGTGIDFSKFKEKELLIDGETEVYPLAVKAEASSLNGGSEGNPTPESRNNLQITQVTFEKEKSDYKARVMKQILWVNGMRYELQEIYGIGNSVEGDVDGNDIGKECVICLSEPRDTTVLPCRHMCMCSSCAKVLRFQTDKCPICRHPVERLLEIKVRNTPDE
ncbi:probable E3 ubiquitin-protein ligase LOG2 [Punica granatum]|uniref:RING-type E3 ubiquitin transferase n=2 Tax=Punica granatum TaxID=22663 RepID=A0A218WAB7_PUNGR|nr:probable E3 ubiquitin-protein ligase LOG2 [Punica granatum]OWM69725.1 hypothetical protein CDL15_Pgr025574 [Punica granatum]PKI68150.1 hypothetical protein CRG98_011449 [Punica granatum]